jgi:hypothetical protein
MGARAAAAASASIGAFARFSMVMACVFKRRPRSSNIAMLRVIATSQVVDDLERQNRIPEHPCLLSGFWGICGKARRLKTSGTVFSGVP